MEQTQNERLHTKFTLAKEILPPLLPGFELSTFRSRVQRSNQQAIPAPGQRYSQYYYYYQEVVLVLCDFMLHQKKKILDICKYL